MGIAEWMYVIGSVLILPAIMFAIVAQAKVSGAFNKYSQIPALRGITAGDLARKLLDENDCRNVGVKQCHGHLSDHYDPRTRTVNLSSSVFGSTSLAALGIAAHEVGHAIQHRTRYAPLILRQVVIKSTSLINKMLMPIIIFGMLASFFITGITIFGLASETFWFIFVLACCIVYSISFVVNLITLPTEYNASARAKKMLASGNYLYDENEKQAVARVLNAAALTYLAALITSLAYMLRFLGLILMLTGRRRN